MTSVRRLWRGDALGVQVLRRLLPPVVAALVLLVIIGVAIERAAVEASTQQLLEQQHARALQFVAVALDGIKQDVRSVAAIDLLRNGLIDTQERYRYLPALFQSLSVGTIVEVPARLSLLDFMGRELVSNDVIGGPALAEVGDPARLEAGEELLRLDASGLFFAAPVTIFDQIEGSVAVSVAPEAVGGLFAGLSTTDAAVALVTSDGAVLYVSRESPRVWATDDAAERAAWLRRQAPVALDGVEGIELWTAVHRPVDAGVFGRQNAMLLIVAAGALAMILAAVVLAATLTARSVRRFADALQGIIDAPHAGVRLPEEGPRELRELAVTFNQTLGVLEQAERDRRAREAAESASRAKSAFLANMSHEIRTPLNAVLGFAQLLERDPALGPRQREQMRTITRSGEHLLKLINDVLDVAKIEAGRVTVSADSVALRTLLADLAHVFGARARAKGLELVLELDDSVPAYARTDEAKLRQVVLNVLGNAVKFTAHGAVALRARTEALAERVPGASGDGPPRVLVVEIEDSGMGIAEHERDAIFSPFTQGDAGLAAGGTGLGLTISQRILGLMGGSMTVSSEVGHGSCFRIEVPLSTTHAEPVVTRAARPTHVTGLAPASTGTSVLVVDDEADNRAVLRAMLEQLGFVVHEAHDGAAGVEAFASLTPDIVLMDMRMPRMDGYEATRRIKATEPGAGTPVIAVTASAFEDDEAKVLAAGVDAYVRKPFRWSELLEVMGRAAGVVFRSADAVDAAAVLASLRRLEALLASDDTAVIDQFDAERATLAALGGASLARLERELGGYDFPAALETVRSLVAGSQAALATAQSDTAATSPNSER